MSLKPEKNDIKAYIKFNEDELNILQENAWQMAESFGLDTRISNLKGKRKVGFYIWDLDYLVDVVDDLRHSNTYEKELTEGLYAKIIAATAYIKSQKNK